MVPVRGRRAPMHEERNRGAREHGENVIFIISNMMMLYLLFRFGERSNPSITSKGEGKRRMAAKKVAGKDRGFRHSSSGGRSGTVL